MVRSRREKIWMLAGVLVAAIATSTSVAAATPSTAPTIEGVWKIASPTNVLKPVSGSVPFTAEGRKRYEANKRLQARRAYDDYDITLSRCSSPGTPRLMLTPERFKIWNRFGIVTLDFEWNRALRQINASGKPPKQDWMGQWLVPTATGTSKARWEGSTLISETVNISDRTLLDALVPHTLDLKVTERLRLLDPDTLENRITIEDAAYFTRPWEAVVTYKRQPDALFPEDVCLDRITMGQPAFRVQP